MGKGKNDFLSPKAIGNRIKSKGLQKLRWYCQLCQKQCRDENGFKCHQLSDSHRRQMDVFGQSADRVVEGFSEDFESSFLEHMRVAHPSSRVAAKMVYNEYINDKNHIHMNSTIWFTLTDFVKHLGKEGKCKVDETPKGWFMSLIQSDPLQVIEEEKRLKRQQNELDEEGRQALALREQAERARKSARTDDGPTEGTALVRDEDAAPMVLSMQPANSRLLGAGAAELGPSSRAAQLAAAKGLRPASAFGDEEDAAGAPSTSAVARLPAAGGGEAVGPPKKALSKLDELMQRGKQDKERQVHAAATAAAAKAAAASAPAAGGVGRRDYWLAPGIVVKVMSKELQEHGYYKQKGVVQRVVERYVGEVSMLDSGDVVRVDQAQLETVLPAPGGTVVVVNGPGVGSRGTLLAINTDKFQAQVEMSDGPDQGRLRWFEYEDICRLAAAKS